LMLLFLAIVPSWTCVFCNYALLSFSIVLS
jgi:hypothetical protein